MELWIRSQDKKHLIKVNNIKIDGTAIITKEKDVVLLGIYYETRALEILDEIQNMIKPTLIHTDYHSEIKQGVNSLEFDVVMTPIEEKITYIQPNVVVYEMPEE